MSEVHALRTFLVQRYPLAAVLHDRSIDDGIFEHIVNIDSLLEFPLLVYHTDTSPDSCASRLPSHAL